MRRLEEIYGVLVGGCRSSTKTAHETSTRCVVEGLQSTVYLEFKVGPPPGLSKRRATSKLIGNNLQCVS